MDAAFLEERIARIKSIIIAFEDAILQLESGAVQTYSLDTGQSKQTVTRFDVARLEARLPSLYNQLATLQARLTGGGVVTVMPSW